MAGQSTKWRTEFTIEDGGGYAALLLAAVMINLGAVAVALS
jgi:hypothetical protein